MSQQQAPPCLTVGTAIRLGRMHADYRRQSHLSEQLGWPVRLVHEFEIGRRRPSPEQLAVLRSKLPLLDLLLRLARPASREIEPAGQV